MKIHKGFLVFALFYVALFLSVPKGYSQIPTASLLVDPLSGTLSAPAGVQFTDTSTGNPTYWFWEFGDGGYRLTQNPLYVFDQPGTYPVTLTVGNAEGLDTVSLVGDYSVQACGNSDLVFSEGEGAFTSIMDAYTNSIFTDISIQLKASPYIEDLIFDTAGVVHLTGGYDCAFSGTSWGIA